MADKLSFEDIALALRSQRMATLASNIANADTPGYKARDINFAEALKESIGKKQELLSTSDAHISTPLVSTVELGYRVPVQPAMDGNTVDMNIERAAFTDNAIRTQLAFQSAIDEYAEIGKMLSKLV